MITRTAVNVACSNVEMSMPLFPEIPLTVLDGVSVTTLEPLPPTPTLPPDPPECVARYAQYLKDRYKAMPTLPEGDWPPSLGRQYTRLAMIEQERELPGAELVATMGKDYIHGNIDNIVKKKKAVQLPEIFLPTEDGGQQLKILMDGAPGIGKSTLSRKVCKDWSNEELLQQYHLVILLPLRQASIREAKSIEDLIEADNSDLKQQIVQHIQETSGEHVLLILDGYDELSNEDRTQNSLFLDIVQGKKFPKCSVLVTSRPYASSCLQQLQSVNRHVEVLGFTEEQIEHCIINNIPEKAKATELVQALKERQDIVSLCYIPLNCAVVLYVYKVEQCTLPHSLTNLYEIFILNAMKRHASITGNEPTIRTLHNLSEVPTSLQLQLNALSKLAYDGLVEDKMVFSIKDIKAAFPVCSDCDIGYRLLGLMTVFKAFTSTGEDWSYQFLHLTIQEFLAAKWAASQLSACELLMFFQDHLTQERYRMVLLFLAGISQLNFPAAESAFLNCRYFNVIHHPDMKAANHFFFLAHLIYESQNYSRFHTLANTIEGKLLSAAWYSLTLFDCLVLAHFLAWCDCSLKLLYLRGCGLTSRSLEIMHRVNLEHHGNTQIEEVNLSHNPLITKLSLLPKLPMFDHTRKLTLHDLQYPEGVSPDQVELHCLLNLRHLTTLEISIKEIPESIREVYSLSLAKFVSAFRNTPKLQVLRFHDGNIDSQNAVDIFKSLEHNTRLEELDLSGNSQLAEGDSEAVGFAIEKMLNMNQTLKVLNISGCNVTDAIAKHILTGLTKNTSLVTLNVNSPELSGSCAVSLFQQMTTHPTVSITVGEVNVLGVGRMKMDRGTIIWYIMDDIIPENCVEFFRALNSSLKVSNLNVHNLTDQTAEHFAVALGESQSVQAMDLVGNKICSTGAVSIFKSLEHNNSLEILDLSENSQLAEGDSEAVGCAIERMLNMNRTLRMLNLSGCNVTDSIVQHILTGLTENTSLVRLHIGSCTLNGRCAVSLFEQMTTHPILSITVGEVNVLGVGRVEMDRGTLLCVMGDLIPENCVEFFRALNNSGLKVSNLNVQHLTDQTAEHLAVGLAESQSVQALRGVGCKINSAAAVSIIRSLEHNTSLEELDLSWNSQLAEGDSEAVGCAVERMLSMNRTLKVLNLYCCRLPNEVAARIANGLAQNYSVRKVILSSNNIGSTGAVVMFRSLEYNISLEELDLSGNSELAEGDSEAVGCAIEKMLNVNRTLKTLNLDGCGLTNEVAFYFANGLAQNHSVKKVNFHSNNIGSHGTVSIFRSLVHNTSLEEIDLSRNRQLAEGDSEAVGCAIEKMLNMNQTLKVLNVSGCNVTDAIAEHILTGLAKNTSLVTLNVSSPKLSGSCAVSLFQQMTTHPTVSITVDVVNVLGFGRVMMNRETIWCAMGDLIPENCVGFFRALNNSGLKITRLSVQDLTDQTAEHFAVGLAESQSAQALRVEYCNISSTGAVSIFRSLEHNTRLEELELSHKIQLTEGDSEAVGCAIERMLKLNRTLKVLNLNDYGLDTTVITHVGAGLAHNASLAELNIRQYTWCRNNIIEEWEHLFKALCNNMSLKKLEISGSKLGMEGSVALAEMLSCNKSLTELNLVGYDYPEAGLGEIARGLLHNTSLKKLCIICNTIEVEESVALAKMLSCNKSLTELSLEWCRIPEVGLREIARGLLHNTSLKKLNISSIKYLGMEGSVALAEMLSCNKSLTELNLSGCYIPEVGLREIARGLLHNTSLKKLDISVNTIEMEESVALAKMLSCNKSLTELNLQDCDIPEAGLREIARGLLQNTTLQALEVEEVTILEAEIERLERSGKFTPQGLSRHEIMSLW